MIHLSMTTDEMYEKLESLLNRIEGEWARSPFKDKFNHYDTTFEYQFEDNDSVQFTFIGTQTVEIRNKSINDFWAIKCQGQQLFDTVLLILWRVVDNSVDRNDS
jgi:hypothetical protein